MNTIELLETWALWQDAQGLSQRTTTERCATMRQLFTYTGANAQSLAPMHIIAFCARKSLSAASKASYHASIRAFCAWMIAAKVRPDDPSAETPRPKRPKGQPRPIAPSNIQLVLRACTRRRTLAYVTLAIYAGMRVHEIAKVHGTDLDLQNRSLTISGKGGKTSVIPLHPAIHALASHYSRNEYWFPAGGPIAGGGHVTAHAVSKSILSAMRRAGVHGKPHQLRHTYATELLDRGADLRVVQELMRHESVATTQIYTRVNLEKMTHALVSLRFDTAPLLWGEDAA